MNKELTIDDLKIIFDVLNVYDPNDIQDVYPEMGEEELAIQQESLKRLNSILLNGAVQQSKVIGHQPYV